MSSKSVRGLLVDPFNQNVIHTIVARDYKQWKKLMNINSPVDMVILEGTIGVIVDDEALLKNNNRYFKLQEYPQPLAGTSIIVGVDYEGNIADVDYDKETIEFLPEGFSIEPRMEFIAL
jgi:hypothetical protein